MKPNYLLIPITVFSVAGLGSLLTAPNIEDWYNFLQLPSFAPSGQIIGTIWTLLYITIAISLIFIWNNLRHDKLFRNIITLFIINGFLNVLWSYTFFELKMIELAILVSGTLAITIYLLIYCLYRKIRPVSYLLIPYAFWVTFATYLNYIIWTLNK